MSDNSKKVSVLEQFIYGSGQIGLNMMFTIFGSYVLYFYTDVIVMNAALIGTVIMLCKFFDGISDLIAGHIIDTHTGKRGHCIPVIMKWSIPTILSMILVFMVPDSSVAVRVAFIFVTYNLYNTVLNTYVYCAYNSLASYVTDDPTTRSKMLCYAMLFAAATQTVMAGLVLPVVNYFGGQTNQTAWIKTVLLFGGISAVFLYLNAFFVKERVENEAPPENFFTSLKAAFKNKYWLMASAINICCSIILMFNLSISIYYLKDVIGNLGLIGVFIACSNIPGIFIALIMPAFLNRISKRSMCIFGGILMLAAQIIFILGPSGSIPLLLGTALLRGIGFGFPMGLVNAMVGDTIEYGEWKTGIKCQAVLFSCKAVAEKLSSGVMTSLFGFYLAAFGYNGALTVQAGQTISAIDTFFRFGPMLVVVCILVLCGFWHLDREMPKIQEDLAARRNTLAKQEGI
ncbi:MFS transporter [Hungatella hathewayi]